MTTDHSALATLSLWAPTGPLDLHDVTVEVIGEGSGQIGLELHADVAAVDVPRLEAEELLGLGPDTIGPGPRPEPGEPGRVTAALSPDLLPFLDVLDGPEDVQPHLAHLALDLPTHPLVDARNWFALRIGRTVELPPDMPGSLEEGASTIWADGPGPLEPVAEGPVSEAVLEAVASTDLPLIQAGEGPLFRFAAPGEHGDALGYIRCFEDAVQAAAFAVWHVPTPPERRTAMMEVVTRANAGLILGNLELDLGDGIVQAKCSSDLGREPVDPDAVALLIVVASRLLDRYLPAIIAVAGGSAEPAAAIAAVEGTSTA